MPEYITIRDAATQYLTGKPLDAVLRRLDGESYEQIATVYGISRESAHLMVMAGIERITTMMPDSDPDTVIIEDRYRHIYSRYRISKKGWSNCPCITDDEYNYLKTVCVKGDDDPEEALMRDDLSEEDREILKELCDSNRSVTIDGNVLRLRTYLFDRYMVQTYCQEPTTWAQYCDLVNSKLKDERLDSKRLSIDPVKDRARRQALRISDFTLWNEKTGFRFYDLEAYDYDRLFAGLKLEQYSNTLLSTAKLFAEHPALMKKYDVRDPLELHNLLRKIVELGLSKRAKKIENMTFERMPILCFDGITYEEMIAKCRMESGAESMSELADYIERNYGMKRKTILNNHIYKPKVKENEE